MCCRGSVSIVYLRLPAVYLFLLMSFHSFKPVDLCCLHLTINMHLNALSLLDEARYINPSMFSIRVANPSREMTFVERRKPPLHFILIY